MGAQVRKWRARSAQSWVAARRFQLFRLLIQFNVDCRPAGGAVYVGSAHRRHAGPSQLPRRGAAWPSVTLGLVSAFAPDSGGFQRARRSSGATGWAPSGMCRRGDLVRLWPTTPPPSHGGLRGANRIPIHWQELAAAVAAGPLAVCPCRREWALGGNRAAGGRSSRPPSHTTTTSPPTPSKGGLHTRAATLG